jgi:hypothetical protein
VFADLAATSSNETVIYVPQFASIQSAGGLAGRQALNLGGSCARNLNPAALFGNPDFLGTIVKCMGAAGGPGLQAVAQGGGWNQIVRVSCVASQPGVPVTVILRASE